MSDGSVLHDCMQWHVVVFFIGEHTPVNANKANVITNNVFIFFVFFDVAKVGRQFLSS